MWRPADRKGVDRQPSRPGSPVRIGVFRDAAFQFYYPENLEALEAAGARLIFVSPLATDTLPDIEAGLNAGVWSAGVVLTIVPDFNSSTSGLTTEVGRA